MESFPKGRDFAAWLGLTPRRHAMGGRVILGRMSRMGQRDIRRSLIAGAMAVVRWAVLRGANDPGLADLLQRKPRLFVAVALVNKMARTIRGQVSRRVLPNGCAANNQLNPILQHWWRRQCPGDHNLRKACAAKSGDHQFTRSRQDDK